MQFYKLLGSSDLLGNPLGFVDKLGTGVVELFSEPKKGFLISPTEGIKGIGRGLTSLSTGVVSAGADSISKVTGSLYSILKSATGQSEVKEAPPTGAMSGMYRGVKGGGAEIYYGITGIFTKPVTGAQKGGVTGFFKGVGKGLLGGVAFPFAAVLRGVSTMTAGVNNTAIRIKKGRLPEYGRFRHPRYINARNIIEVYDPGFAECQ